MKDKTADLLKEALDFLKDIGTVRLFARFKTLPTFLKQVQDHLNELNNEQH